jgi:hypothetical protein
MENDLCVLKDKLQADCLLAMEWFKSNNMKANASKFQLMYLTRNDQILNETLQVGDDEIKPSQSIDILGVEIDRNLRFNLHIDEICCQTGKQINALKRIKHTLDKDCKMIIYNSYINSNFNYCSPVWMFTNQCNLDKLERTNKRALRFATNKEHRSYENICEEESQLSVFRKCVKATAILIYKARKGIGPSYVNELFTLQESQYEMRDNNKLALPNYNTVSYGKNSMRFYGAKLWNNIPVSIKSCNSLNTFNQLLTIGS